MLFVADNRLLVEHVEERWKRWLWNRGLPSFGTWGIEAVGNGETANYKHIVTYGDDAKWPSVVWITIGILCVCGLAVLLFIR
jgi:hypothetical protein